MRNTFVLRLAILIVIAGLSGTLGCNIEGIGSAEVPIAEISSVPAWDAGILLPGSATSVLFPLDDPAIESAEDIVAITSSCDCTTAEAWNYWDDDGRRRVAIRVHMLEKSGPPRKSTAVRLGVLLTIKTRTGDIVERTVRVLLSAESEIRHAATSRRTCQCGALASFLHRRDFSGWRMFAELPEYPSSHHQPPTRAVFDIPRV